MNLQSFIQEIDNFISSLLSSEIYLKYKELDLEISSDSEIASLVKERNSFYDSFSLDRSKKENLVSAKKVHDKIISLPKVKEYYYYQKKIRDILSIINEQIYKEVFL